MKEKLFFASSPRVGTVRVTSTGMIILEDAADTISPEEAAERVDLYTNAIEYIDRHEAYRRAS